MLNFQTATLTTTKHRTCFSDYRFRNATNWTDKERREIREMFPDGGDAIKIGSDDEAEEMLKIYTAKNRKNASTFHKHCNAIKEKLGKQLDYNEQLPTLHIDANAATTTRRDRMEEKKRS
jgi:hypothetical protein